MKIFEELEVGGYYLNGYKRVIGPIEIIDNHDESGRTILARKHIPKMG